MDEQLPATPPPTPEPPAYAPTQAGAESPSPYRPITAAILIAALIIGGSFMGSAMYLGDKLDAVRLKLGDIGSLGDNRPGAADEGDDEGPARVDMAKLVSDDDPQRGPKDAKVTIVEFSDYQCPFCERFFQQTLPALRESYGDKIRFAFKDFPLPMHPDANKAHEAARCAGDEGKYWEMHDMLFENRSSLGVESLKRYARNLGLNAAKFNDCLESGKYEKAVKADVNAGRAAGVNGTPTFFINGERLVGAQPVEVFREKIDALLQQ